MSDKKRPSSASSSSKSKRKKSSSSKSSSSAPAASLFRTLAALESDDALAATRRTHRADADLARSRAAADQVSIGRTLLELRIMTQRTMTELTDIEDASAAAGSSTGAGATKEEEEELDSLLETLLKARRELTGDGEGGGASVDFAALIQNENKKTDGEDDNAKETLESALKNEYDTCKSRWKTVLDRRHRDLQLHSGGKSSSSSRFSRGGAVVDAGFWDQVEGSARHDRFHRGGEADTSSSSSGFVFDDARLYQRMLQDFISSSSSGSGGGKADVSKDAASRLKRATRKSGEHAEADGGAGDFVSGRADVGRTSKTNDVDRRASKGRKIRYAVYPKMVNFTFPVHRPEPTIDEDAWFDSLFGGVGRAR